MTRARKRSPAAAPRSELIELVAESLGAQGDGIAHWDGETIFLPFTAPGDRVRVELGVRRGPGREGRVIELIEEGPHRAAPLCRHFGRCGGCALQHLAPADYRAVKLGALSAALRRVGIEPGVVAPLVTVPPHRRRARIGLARTHASSAPVIVGFRERFRHALLDVEECAVLEPALFALIDPLRRAAAAILPPGGAAEATLTRCDGGVDILIETKEKPGLVALEALAALAETHDLVRVVWRHGQEDVPVVERRPVRVVFSGVAVPFPPGAFLQASAAAEATLVAEVVAAVDKNRPALDLYAGLGTFSFALAQNGMVHAVEGDATAARALAEAAARMPRVTAERRDLDREPLSPAELTSYAAVVFDPPRAGARRQAEALAASTIETVIAVSCNPATFARDAALLVAGGYRLEKVMPLDQFVWTPHLELVAVFRR
ncbi:MAG: class I SAM-dependent RNA methyltransferase [Stellaceae bacterium]